MRILGIREFADKNGVSEAVVRGWIYRHGLRVIKIGKKIYIDDTDYLHWLDERKRTLDGGFERDLASLPGPESCYCPAPAIAAKMRKIY